MEAKSSKVSWAALGTKTERRETVDAIYYPMWIVDEPQFTRDAHTCMSTSSIFLITASSFLSSTPPALSHAQPLCMAQLKSAMMNCGPSLKPLKNLSMCREAAIKGAVVLRSTNKPPESYYNIAKHAETCNCRSLGGENEIKPADAEIKALSRKALIEVQDYDYGGANPRHDPRRGKPGNGGKNP